MIHLYSWSTPNGYKPLIMLEETELAYSLIPVPLNGEQLKPAYTRINPNGKIPAIIDLNPAKGTEEVTVFESGAILIYLAEKAHRFLPPSGPARYEVLQWLMFQMGGIGPMFGQYNHFHNAAKETIPYAKNRYKVEVDRLYSVMEHRLSETPYLAGEYSIADMAIYPWAKQPEYFGVAMDSLPNIKRWIQAMSERPAVQRAMAISFK